jgi:sulfite exporter TauE/SafE
VIELPLIFVTGILGTAHCLGMCGPMALAIGSAAQGWPSAIAKQLVYTAGRIFSYGVLGSAAGYCGARLVHSAPVLINIPATLAVIAGAFLIYQGLQATGIFRRRGVSAAAGPCLAGGFIGQYFRQPNYSGVLLAGVLTGFLPCGLLYGMLALAMTTHSVFLGGTTMVIFGLGTAPAMMLAGVSGRLIGLATRRWIYAAAAWCLVLTGVVSVARGVSFLSATERSAARCPLCTH